jgi:transcriptional regulator with XRE-family HTH domain
MSVAQRWIEIPGENQHQMVAGFVLKNLARQCEFSAEELANKARMGVGYVQKIFNGLAPFMQEYQIFRLCQAMDVKMSDFYVRVEKTNFSQVRTLLKIEDRIVAAGGARVKPVKKGRLKIVKGGVK